MRKERDLFETTGAEQMALRDTTISVSTTARFFFYFRADAIVAANDLIIISQPDATLK